MKSHLNPTQSPTLERFIDAQSGSEGVGYEAALTELMAGRKTSHWIWYVLPQLRGLGRSALAREYGLVDTAEASAYLAHPVLGPRLVQCVQALLAHQAKGAVSVLGEVDAVKLRSCLTLFEHAAPHEPIFGIALERLYGGVRDAATLDLIAQARIAGAATP